MSALLFGFCLLVTALPASAKATISAKSVEQWGREEITLHSGHAYSNPFTQVQLSARFTSHGKSVVAPGYYDGELTWRIRFMPEQQGEWHFTTSSNDPDLNNQSGSFVVRPPSAGNHGPVVVAKKFHFSYSDGTPYFLLGTTLYNWLNRDDALQNETLATLSKSPFTKVRFGLFPKWYEFNRVEPAMYPYVEISPQKFDLNQFNPNFVNTLSGVWRIWSGSELRQISFCSTPMIISDFPRWMQTTMTPISDTSPRAYLDFAMSGGQWRMNTICSIRT